MNLQQRATGGNRECSSEERQSSSSTTTTIMSTHNNGQGNPSSPSSETHGAIIGAAGTTSRSTEQQQQQQQKQQYHQLHVQPREVVHHPKELDILSGRVSGIFNHPGNRLFRRLVDANKPLYRACPRRLKPLLAQSIVDAMAMQHSSRFLKVIEGDAAANDDGANDTATTPSRWYDIGRAAAIAKTCQALREGGSSSSSTTTTTITTSHDEVSHIICETHVPTCCDIVHTTTATAAGAAAVVVLSDSDDDDEEDSGSDGDVSSGRSNSPRSCRLLSSTVLDDNDENLNYDSDEE
jgi:hypothetical protein